MNQFGISPLLITQLSDGENFKDSLNWHAKTLISFLAIAFASSMTEWLWALCVIQFKVAFSYVIVNKSNSMYVLPASLKLHSCRSWKALSPVLYYCWQASKIPVIFGGRQAPQCQINCQILEPQNLSFPRWQCHY